MVTKRNKRHAHWLLSTPRRRAVKMTNLVMVQDIHRCNVVEAGCTGFRNSTICVGRQNNERRQLAILWAMIRRKHIITVKIGTTNSRCRLHDNIPVGSTSHHLSPIGIIASSNHWALWQWEMLNQLIAALETRASWSRPTASQVQLQALELIKIKMVNEQIMANDPIIMAFWISLSEATSFIDNNNGWWQFWSNGQHKNLRACHVIALLAAMLLSKMYSTWARKETSPCQQQVNDLVGWFLTRHHWQLQHWLCS